ncbi:unnamed protein product [Effrenium voratum]|uniref:Uncharacterized protein n=1 Tax=Effrenium voratum TaxID=2562239 RepID=A0AA36MGR8_9DINO|nr:unnamed protein product [Effrenium voratum]
MAFLALQGGGVRAFASDAGVLAGLACAANKSVAELAGAFEATSSVSGSSWFAAELFYSPSFAELMAGMAASPSTAAAQFQENWIQPWLRATQVSQPTFDGLQSIVRLLVRLLLGTGDEDTIFIAQFFLASGLTWTHFVEVLLNSTAAIPKQLPLGAEPTMAQGRHWLVDHSLLLPVANPAAVYRGGLGLFRTSYSATTKNGELPVFLPAKFSVALGAGVHRAAPLPYLAQPQLPIEFSYQGHWPLGGSSSSSGPLVLDAANGSLGVWSGHVPVSAAAAASSAVFGAEPVDGLPAVELASLLKADVAVWAAIDGFEVADQLRAALAHPDAQKVAVLGQEAVHALIDGGYTDGTGIAQAVASGAEEVVVVLNSYSSNLAEYVAQLFPGGPVTKPGVPKELYPVFSAPSAAAVDEAFAQFRQLQIAEGSSYLKVLAVGSFEATTAKNAYFGTEEGRQVSIRIINVCSELSIGFFANFGHYSALVQEVALSLAHPKNRAELRTVLPWFAGKAAKASKALVV